MTLEQKSGLLMKKVRFLLVLRQIHLLVKTGASEIALVV